MISISGGEAEKITDEESAVSQFRWSPDGKSIAYIVRDTPKDKAEREKRKKEKFDAIVVDSDFTYSHLWTIRPRTRREETDHRRPVHRRRPAVVARRPVDRLRSQSRRARRSPVSRTSPKTATPTSLWSRRSGGQPRQLTTNRGPDSQPRWSPDGKQIAYRCYRTTRIWAAKTDLMVVPSKAATPHNLTASYNGLGLRRHRMVARRPLDLRAGRGRRLRPVAQNTADRRRAAAGLRAARAATALSIFRPTAQARLHFRRREDARRHLGCDERGQGGEANHRSEPSGQRFRHRPTPK